MIHRALSTSVALGIMLSAAPAVGQNVDKDVRCLMVSQMFSKMEKDPAKKQVAGATALFYFGRVDAQASGSALGNRFIAQNAVIKQQNAGQLMTACATEFNARQQALQASVKGAMQVTQPKK